MSLPQTPFYFRPESEEQLIEVMKYLQSQGIVWESGDGLYPLLYSWLHSHQNNPLEVQRNNKLIFSPLPLGELLTPISDIITKEPQLSNEQILVQFLKHHRKWSAFKRNYYPEYANVNTLPVEHVIVNSFPWDLTPQKEECWDKLNSEWRKLCRSFSLTGAISYPKLLSIR